MLSIFKSVQFMHAKKRLQNTTKCCGIALALLLGANGFAEEPQAPWTHPEVLKAAFQIGMTAEQQPKFRAAITEFLSGFNSDVQRLMRANNQTNLPRKIASRRKARVKSMDEEMQTVLTQTQYPAYEQYRDALLTQMDANAAARRRAR